MRVMVLGANGMLGSAVFRQFCARGQHETWGLVRSEALLAHFTESQRRRMITGVDALEDAGLAGAFALTRPDIVINCIGFVKQQSHADDPLKVLPINAMLPHRLEALCAGNSARLVQISTDCVFSGRKGQYTEDDPSDANDLYGKSKYIGEVRDMKHAVTLRTSIIGHELNSSRGLVDWFLEQKGTVHGFTRSVFSGMTAIELARVMHDFLLPNSRLHGVFHVSAAPISKFDLLRLIAAEYGKMIDIIPNDQPIIDRSLNSSTFRRETGYHPPSWENMVREMHQSRK